MYLKWKDKTQALKYLDAFFRASSNDQNLKKIAQSFDIPWVWTCHDHGRGYLLVSADNINDYTCWKYFLNDQESIKILKQQLNNIEWEFLLMLEARVTDIGFVSSLNAHPFKFISRNGYEGRLFYNGLLDYEKLADLEWIDFKNYKTKNWTTIMWICIANALEKWMSFHKAILEPMKALQTAYNVMFFLHDQNWNYKSFVCSYVKEELFEKDFVKNHNSLIYKQHKDLFFAWNTSIKHEIEWDFQTFKNWEIMEFEIDFINEYFFDWYKV